MTHKHQWMVICENGKALAICMNQDAGYVHITFEDIIRGNIPERCRETLSLRTIEEILNDYENKVQFKNTD